MSVTRYEQNPIKTSAIYRKKDVDSVNSAENFAALYKWITRLWLYREKTSDYSLEMRTLRTTVSLETDGTGLKRVILPGHHNSERVRDDDDVHNIKRNRTEVRNQRKTA